MTRRKRIPLELKGSDEQYFRTREVQTRPEMPAPPAADAPEPAPTPAAARRPRPKAAPQPFPAEGDGEVISRIVPVGPALSARLAAVSAETGVAVPDLLYAARKKAVARFRRRIAGPAEPDLPKPEKGGATIRISFKLTADELARLKAWFDPLDLGIATKTVAPLLADALRREVRAICDAAAPG